MFLVEYDLLKTSFETAVRIMTLVINSNLQITL